RSLATVTRAPTAYREAAPGDRADQIWVLCVGREPSLVDVRDGFALHDGGERVRERYLRLLVSSVARLACVQEVALELDLVDGVPQIRQLAQPGV
ncbi:hypothetical protein ACI4CV_27175, partial [Klebsiella pneumoniae]|uniref:hypothetical protein n=1 Tax=Klebsiella pneumoniae TaxID=573 RepID=UPI00385547CC